MSNGTCSVGGCGKPIQSTGLCSMHKARLKRTGSLELTPRPPRAACSVDGCDRQARTRGMCPIHTERMRHHGTTELSVRKPRQPRPPCSVDGCNTPLVMRNPDLCMKHYSRVVRKGHTGEPTPRIPKPYRHSQGYWVLHDKSHPLADNRGWVYEHRVVLYSKIGAGSHPCTHCDRVVAWGVDLAVDHLDWNRANNDPTNLVPSCQPCNARRTRKRTAA